MESEDEMDKLINNENIDREKVLLLIDGNSIINRAFFALPPMDNGDGQQTNAIYGFLTMMFKMIDIYKPTHISVAFDMKAPRSEEHTSELPVTPISRMPSSA